MDNNIKLKKKFRTIFITLPAYNFSTLNHICEKLEFLMTGSEPTYDEAIASCRDKLQEFDPQQDAIVVTGSANKVFLAGMALREVMVEHYLPAPLISIQIGKYIRLDDGKFNYQWEIVNL